jgi:hypothetical protein
MSDYKRKGNYEKTIVIPIDKDMWKALRKISFEQEKSMSELTRTALKKIINKYEKNVDLG